MADKESKSKKSAAKERAPIKDVPPEEFGAVTMGIKDDESEFKGVKVAATPGHARLVIPPPAIFIFEISYVKDGDMCRVLAKGTNYEVNVDSTNVPPSEAFVNDLIRGYLNTRPQ